MHQVILMAILALASGSTWADNWPQFRGPRGNGHAQSKHLPLTWSETQNIKWKTSIHDRGHSSPVIWDKQVWLTSATPDGRQLFAFCLGRDDGKVIHDLRVFDVEKPEFCHPLNSYASPTPVIEPGRVYVHFGTYGTACFDTDTGRRLWERRDLHCNHFRGPGSSPLLYQDLLILTFDGFDVQYLVALDKATGKTVWRTDRSTDFGQADGDQRKAFCTPILIEHEGRPLLISPGSYMVMAYEPKTGKELWKVSYRPGFSSTARPLFAQGLIFVFSGFGRSELLALRPGGQGDVTESHVVWKSTKAIPQKPSAVLCDGLLLMVNDSGVASCVEAMSGKSLWQQRLGGQFSASALEAAGRVYFFDQEGTTTVIAADRDYRLLAVNQLDQGCMATPAVSGDALFLRTKTHLYRIEE